MLSRKQKFTVVVAAMVVCVAVVSFLFARSKIKKESNVSSLDRLPDGSFLVATLRLDLLRNTPLSGVLGAAVAKLGNSDVRSQCGFEPIDQLKDLTLWIPEKTQQTGFALVGFGSFARDEFSTCAERVIRGRGGDPTIVVGEPFTLIESRRKTSDWDRAKLGISKDGTLLLTDDSLFPLIATSVEHPSSTTNAKHRNLLTKFASNTFFTLTAVLPQPVRDKLRDEIPPQSVDANNVAAGLLGAETIGAALAREPQNQVSARVEVGCDRPGACEQLKTFVIQKRDALKSNMMVRLFGVSPLLDHLQVEQSATTLSLRTEINEEDAKHLLERVIETFLKKSH